MTDRIVPMVIKRQVMELAESGKRTDGRSLTEARPLQIETGVIDKAEGSATVLLGNTRVTTGVKFEIGTPFPDTPNDGVMSVSAEFVPFASPEFETGPPDENSVELARVVDRGLRESKLLDTSKLCIIPGKKVWIAWVDIYILDHCGNLIDAAALSALCALLTSKMPEAVLDGENVIVTENKLPVPLRDVPVNVTLAKIGDKLFVDPSLEEEEVMDCRLSITFTQEKTEEDGTVVPGKVCATQKGFSGILTPEEVKRAFEIAKVKSQEWRKIVNSVVKTNG